MNKIHLAYTVFECFFNTPHEANLYIILTGEEMALGHTIGDLYESLEQPIKFNPNGSLRDRFLTWSGKIRFRDKEKLSTLDVEFVKNESLKEYINDEFLEIYINNTNHNVCVEVSK